MPLPAQGEDGRMFEGVASGTVTRGDILKGTPDALVRNTTDAVIVGIAASGSDNSINGKITYIVPGADEAYWCDVDSASTLAAGDTVMFSWVTAANAFQAVSSATTIRGHVLKGVDDIVQDPGKTRIQVQFARSNTLFS